MSIVYMLNMTCLRGPGYPKRVLYSLVTIQAIQDTWTDDLRDTASAFLHFFGTKMTKFFWVKNFKKCGRPPFQILNNFPWNSGFPGGLLGINFMIQQENLDFATTGTALFAHFQIQSKTAKTAIKLQKCQNLADLSILSKILAPNYVLTDFEAVPIKKSWFSELFKISRISPQ